MFARTHRFSFKRGAPRKTFASRFFLIKYGKNNESKLRCSVVVGKKVDKRAVVRNKIKRRTVALIQELVKIDAQIDLVVIARPAIRDVEPKNIEEDLAQGLKSIQII